MSTPPQVLFLVSDPLNAPISVEHDLLRLREALQDLSCGAHFYLAVAEADAVQGLIARSDRPRFDILHYFGHGYSTGHWQIHAE
jgi:hypothetical protein